MAITDNTGPKTSRELQEENIRRQTGEPDVVAIGFDDNPPEPLTPAGQSTGNPRRKRRDITINDPHGTEMGDLGKASLIPMTPSRLNRNVQEEAQAQGWGESRYDVMSGFQPESDIEGLRARQQSGFWKVADGLLKGGVTYGTTAVDTVLGTVWGAGAALFEAAGQAFGEKSFNVKDIIDAGVNNWVNEQMFSIQRKAEEWFPNYRTEAERSDQYQREWYKHLLNPNTIGDVFLKNFGFTVGAMRGGSFWTKLIGSGMAKRLGNDVMKGVVAAANGDMTANEALKKTIETLKQIDAGVTTVTGSETLMTNIKNAAKRINAFEPKLSIIGASLGALSEGSIEGIMARNEFLEKYIPDLERYHYDSYVNLENKMKLEDSDGVWFTSKGELTDEGKAEKERRLVELGTRFSKLRDEAYNQADRLAGTTFMWNFPILTMSNYIQFGKMLGGGWKTTKGIASKVEGGLTRTKGAVAANYNVANNTSREIMSRAAKVGISEASEEMLQGAVSSGARNVADSRLTAYADSGFDKEAMKGTGKWFRQMGEGAFEYLSDIKNWQEGFMGLLTGLVGVPSWRGGFHMEGGVFGASREVMDEAKFAKTAAGVLNNRVNNETFISRWKSYIRHLAHEREMEKAVLANDQYAWKTEERAQLIGDIIAFRNAGKLEDLLEFVDSFANIEGMTDEEINAVKAAMVNVKDGVTIDKISRKQVEDRIKSNADDLKKAIQENSDIYDALLARAPIGTSNDKIEELVYTAQNIREFEKRYVEMLGEVMQTLDPIFRLYNGIEEPEKLPDVKQFSDYYTTIKGIVDSFSGGIPQHNRYWFRNEKKILDSLEDLMKDIQIDDEALTQKVADMRKVSQDRQEFYEKLAYLEKMPSDKYDKKVKANEEKLKKEIQAEVDSEDPENIDNADTIEALKTSFRGTTAEDRIRKMNQLEAMTDKPEHVVKFLELAKTVDDFKRNYIPKVLIKHGILPNGKTSSLLITAVNTAYDKASSADQFKSMRFSDFSSDERNTIFNTVTTVTDVQRTAYVAVFPGIFDAMMNDYQKGGLQNFTAKEEEALKNSPEAGRRGNLGKTVDIPGIQTTSVPTGTDTPVPPVAAPSPAATQEQPPQPTSGEQPTTDNDEEPDPMKEYKPNNILVADTKEDLGDVSEEQSEAENLPDRASTKISKNEKSLPWKFLENRFPEVDAGIDKKTGNARPNTREKYFEILKIKGRKERLEALKNFVFHWLKDESRFAKIFQVFEKFDMFKNMVGVKVGDEVSFVIDPDQDAPESTIYIYSGNKMVGVLPETGRYEGLQALRDEIMREYKEKADGKGRFVFSKTSTVWGKRKGFIRFDYSGQGEKPLNSIHEGQQIVIIGRNGVMHIGGNATFDVTEVENVLTRQGVLKRGKDGAIRGKGKIYVLADDGAGSFVPVRVFVKHLDSGQYQTNQRGVQQWFETTLKDVMMSLKNKMTADNIEEVLKSANDELHVALHELSSIIDIHKVFFSFMQTEDGVVQLVVNFNKMSEDEYNKAKAEGRTKDITKNYKYYDLSSASIVKDPENGSRDGVDHLISMLVKDFIKADLPFQLRLTNQSVAESDTAKLLKDGLMTTNAVSLVPVNVNFYFETWDDDKKQFFPRKYQADEIADATSTVQSTAQSPVTAAPQPTAPVSQAQQAPQQAATAPVTTSRPSLATTSVAPSTPSMPSMPSMGISMDDIPAIPTKTLGTIDKLPEEIDGNVDDPFAAFDRPMFQITGVRPSPISAEARQHAKEEAKKRKMAQMRVVSALYKELGNARGLSSMNMGEKKLKKRLRNLGVSTPVIRFLTEGIRMYPELKDVSPYEAIVQLSRMMGYDMAKAYDESVGRQIDKGLNDFLESFLAKYNVRVKTGDLEKIFGKGNIAGAYEVTRKIIWLSENEDRMNEMTFPEEFAHAFLELMGTSMMSRAETSDYKFLFHSVVGTDIYKQVYDRYKDIYKRDDGTPDEYLIRKEAIGQALATAIIHNWREDKIGKNEENNGFWNQLKVWFQDIIRGFKGANISFEDTLDRIAKEVLAGDTSRLVKLDSTGFDLLDYVKTFVHQHEIDGGKALDFMKKFSRKGNIITGSLSMRLQGAVYRSKLDSLHDIDMIVPSDVHNIYTVGILEKYHFNTRGNQDFFNDVVSQPYFKEFLKEFPNSEIFNVFNNGRGKFICVSAIECEDEELRRRFMAETGSYSKRLEAFTEEERQKIYLFDFFLVTPRSDATVMDMERELRFSDFRTPIREKLKMGRAKDLYDYQMWQAFEEYSELAPDPRDMLYQATSPDRQQEAVDNHAEEVKALYDDTNMSESEKETVATATTIVGSQGPKRVVETKHVVADWFNKKEGQGTSEGNFILLMNAVVTETEKMELVDAISEAYGDPSKSGTITKMMADYNRWRLDRVLPNIDEDSKKLLDAVYSRMEAITDRRAIFQSSAVKAMRIVGVDSSVSNGEDIGVTASYDSYEDLPSEAKEMVDAMDISEDEYDDASYELKDKILKCVGL